MSNFKFWSWDKKPRTMLRFVKPGDIFCFKIDDNTYRFGRIMSKIITGHIAEIFDHSSEKPEITMDVVNKTQRLIPPIIIDTYGLLDKKVYKDGDWRIIGHQENYIPQNVSDVYFAFGIGNNCNKKDFYGNNTPISESEWEALPKLSPKGNLDIITLLNNIQKQ
ncbi:immunity 26/phosphotriesterase HocA family protein [Candidatus Pantoea multigeneris]|uniref:Phosphotriesterase n=1 Tax=Candidatus Pantoea multigeneris TaxID=2608357 RepID=A0ABX0RGH7_9GAMM|nr:immunity 26/phosphotriesterase HocA family protein [Pantoea multigeneris]NIF24406.1 phosphotriesterase [Pantoea multigeneris]